MRSAQSIPASNYTCSPYSTSTLWTSRHPVRNKPPTGQNRKQKPENLQGMKTYTDLIFSRPKRESKRNTSANCFYSWERRPNFSSAYGGRGGPDAFEEWRTTVCRYFQGGNMSAPARCGCRGGHVGTPDVHKAKGWVCGHKLGIAEIVRSH